MDVMGRFCVWVERKEGFYQTECGDGVEGYRERCLGCGEEVVTWFDIKELGRRFDELEEEQQ